MGVVAFVWLDQSLSRSSPQSNEVLTNAADVLSLSPEQAARGEAVRVIGIVTAAVPEWEGRFYVQDKTGGIFVNNLGHKLPKPGDWVEVDGITAPGPFAPIIASPRWTKLGTAPLPPAKPVTVEQLMAGVEACQRVEISGIVRSAQLQDNRLVINLMSGGFRLRVLAPIPPGVDPQSLLAARVRVRGTAVTLYNASLRQMVTVWVYVPVGSDFTVESSESANPFNQPLIPLNSIVQYRRDNFPGKRVHVKGAVIYQRPGADLFLEDESGGLQVQTGQTETFARGDMVEAVGFPEVENFLPVLQDAFVKKTDEPGVKPTPQAASLRGIAAGLHQADFITLKAKVVDRIVRRTPPQMGKFGQQETILMLQSSNVIFTAQLDAPGQSPELTTIPLGSTVEINGICLTKVDELGKVESFQILIPTPRDVRILARPSWLTPQHLLICVGVIVFILILISSWTIAISRKNSALNVLVRDKEKAQTELQQAHDLLEERVKERTAQLKFEMTARKEAEVQFKAVLAERTRLARELHDTLEQSLTGIGLQLDTAGRLSANQPEAASHHLELARNLIIQSQTEIRHSIWDLRSRELEQFNLPDALLRNARQATDGTNIQVEVETEGDVRGLSEIVEGNLLRIGQEALTNVIKHSGASLVKIELAFGPQEVILQITDNGCGFDTSNGVGPQKDHFGLLGMSERVKRIQGRFFLRSSPGNGTSVRVEVPASLPPEAETPSVPEESGII
ncbi:MAG TPA: histidine kinase [Candidatus Sulfopaludibacter sp.]|nr:histidine kinase [Candidatus Sulfopaludibacter sp.]